jgi:hypothetical protein
MCVDSGGDANLLQGLCHDLRSVVDGEDNVCDTCSSQRLDLVQNHRLVAELNEGLRKGEGLSQGEAIVSSFLEN